MPDEAPKQDAYAPQFEGGGPAVLVRNTFIDVDTNTPSPGDLTRASTAPAAARYLEGDQQNESDEDEEEEDGEDDVEDRAIPAYIPSDAQAPEASTLHRLVTRDWYEPHEGWSWAMQATPSPAMATPAPAVMGMGMGAVPSVPAPAPAPAPAQMAAPSSGMAMYYAPVATGPMPVVVPVTMGMGVGMGMSVGSDMSNVMAPVAPAPLSMGSWSTGPAPSPPGAAPVPAAMGSGEQPVAADQEQLQQQQQPSAPQPHAAAPQPQTLDRHFSIASGNHRIHWTVDGRKLRGNDKQAVSPPFELPFGSYPSVTFKMMIYPKAVNEGKGGASFKKAKGRGYIQLKCEAELNEAIANVAFRISIGSGDQRQPPRGPVYHNFSMSAVCGLPKDNDEWDFHQVVDRDSMTFLVCLEIVPVMSLQQ